MKKFDIKLFISIIITCIYGCIMIYSSSCIWAEYKFENKYHYFIMQLIFLIIGIIIMILVSKVDYKVYLKKSNKILFICIILLILVLIPGIGKVRNGSRSWFGIGGLGIQPSEFMKLALIIFTSKYIHNNPKCMSSVKKGAFPILLVTIISFLLIMLQPDFGTGTILVITIISMLFISGIETSFFIKSMFVLISLASILILAAPYRLKRVVSFLNPWSDPLGTGFQAIQSLYAIGPGGLFGLGFGNSIQKHFYLPEPQTDFIFSIISEELGILGIISVAALFLFIIIRCVKISAKAPDMFSKFISFGILFQLSFQALLNLSVVVGLIPVTGVTLPFFSYGGSSLLITMISMGIILNISRHEK
ncbi:MAG: putative lipid II flippase FtsW [Tenericutes bacterium]|nr:putative lipid II flippase FtsW [Mycoplasmatota bacterium]